MSKIKIVSLILAFLVLLSSFVAWNLLFLAFGEISGNPWVFRVLLPSVAFILLGSLIGLVCLLESDWRAMLGTIFLAAAPFFIFFYTTSFYKLGLAFLGLVFLSRGIYKSWREKHEKIKVVLADILLKGLGPTITGLALLASIGFFGSFYAQSLSSSEIMIPRPIFDKIMDSLMTAPETLKQISAAQKSQELSVQAEQENEQMKEEVYLQISRYLNAGNSPYKRILPLALAFSFFFVIRFWGAILMRLAAMLAWAWFGLLQLFRVAAIKKVPAEKEVIEI